MRTDYRAGVRQRRQPPPHGRVYGEIGVRGERSHAQSAVGLIGAAKLLEPVDGDQVLRQRRLPLARTHDQIGAARHHPRTLV